MGGALLQKLDRDTFKFAMKCSSIRVNGEWRNVSKNPITDVVKKSKAGRISLFQKDGEYFTEMIYLARWIVNAKEVLVPVYENGKLLKEYTFDEVRENVKI
jgi:nicotinamide phosphoribosyltransferase